MELSEPNLSSNEITDSDLNEVEIKNVLELELFDDSHNSVKSNVTVEDVVKALSSQTRRLILLQIQNSKDGMDVSNIASSLDMTEANISAQIKKLQEAGLILCNYCSGNHGVRKISNIKFSQIIINL
ncbi:MAG: ArsR/SmtB family transcription factor [Promethearchaeota archaeon]